MRASMHWPLSDAFVPLRPSPADADGAFMAKLIPAVQAVTLAGADDSDDTTFNASDVKLDTTYGGDVFFNITSWFVNACQQ
jgi:hypothetical protein